MLAWGNKNPGYFERQSFLLWTEIPLFIWSPIWWNNWRDKKMNHCMIIDTCIHRSFMIFLLSRCIQWAIETRQTHDQVFSIYTDALTLIIWRIRSKRISHPLFWVFQTREYISRVVLLTRLLDILIILNLTNRQTFWFDIFVVENIVFTKTRFFATEDFYENYNGWFIFLSSWVKNFSRRFISFICRGKNILGLTP